MRFCPAERTERTVTRLPYPRHLQTFGKGLPMRWSCCSKCFVGSGPSGSRSRLSGLRLFKLSWLARFGFGPKRNKFTQDRSTMTGDMIDQGCEVLPCSEKSLFWVSSACPAWTGQTATAGFVPPATGTHTQSACCMDGCGLLSHSLFSIRAFSCGAVHAVSGCRCSSTTRSIGEHLTTGRSLQWSSATRWHLSRTSGI